MWIIVLSMVSCFTRTDSVQVVGQSEPVVAVAGDDVILSCILRNTVSTVNAVDEVVEWQRLDLKPKEVHFYRNRVDYNADQNPSYRGRTSLFKEEMKNGNISLKLRNVTVSDAGKYTCFVPTLKSLKWEDSVELIVGAVSRPVISIVGFMGVVLQCEVKGLIYKYEVTWLDSDGNILPAGPTEIQTDSEGRYTVRGEVTIQKTDDNMFTCRVNQQQINHTMETQIHLPDRMIPISCPDPWHSWWRGWWFGALTWGLIVFIAVAGVLLILKMRGLLHWGKENKSPKPTEIELPERRGMSTDDDSPLRRCVCFS
ncbi:hypothetical protein UPYG_G00243490 [Umbra pygmaea]|uniref:Ig-like domain-containing protein n=1 Tax=Umbra pygmaea TaxID=75934 RepID=A0ABD0WGK9_UMBPY